MSLTLALAKHGLGPVIALAPGPEGLPANGADGGPEAGPVAAAEVIPGADDGRIAAAAPPSALGEPGPAPALATCQVLAAGRVAGLRVPPQERAAGLRLPTQVRMPVARAVRHPPPSPDLT